jgi:hypothetical protein
MTQVTVVQEVSRGRKAEYSAFIEGHPEICGYGNSEREALGDLMMRHQLRFDLEIRVKTD